MVIALDQIVTPLASLASASAGIDVDRVPAKTLLHATRVIADTIGVILAGGRDIAVSRYAAGVRSVSSNGAQLLTGRGQWVSPESAAFVNGTAGGTLELDGGCRPYGHPAMHVLPAVLAMAQDLHRSGDELLGAFLSGYEACARLFSAYELQKPVHSHGHLGGIGAAVGTARLMKLGTPEAAEVAATTPLLPVWNGCYEGATARNSFMGVAASTAIRSCALSAAGFIGSSTSLDAAFNGLAARLVNPNALTDPVDDTRLSINENYSKPYGACALLQTAIGAGLALRPEWLRRAPTGDTEVHVQTVQSAMHLAIQPRCNDLSVRFSLQYAVAAALELGVAGLLPLTYSEVVAKLASRITVDVKPELEQYGSTTVPARVTIGRSAPATAEVIYPYGDFRNPMTPSQLKSKFITIVNCSSADRLYDRIVSLRDLDDCCDLLPESYWARGDGTDMLI